MEIFTPVLLFVQEKWDTIGATTAALWMAYQNYRKARLGERREETETLYLVIKTYSESVEKLRQEVEIIREESRKAKEAYEREIAELRSEVERMKAGQPAYIVPEPQEYTNSQLLLTLMKRLFQELEQRIIKSQTTSWVGFATIALGTVIYFKPTANTELQNILAPLLILAGLGFLGYKQAK